MLNGILPCMAICAAIGGLETPAYAPSNLHVLYTVGTGNRPRDMLVKALNSHGVRVLVDIRSRPYSRNRDYNREELRVALEKEGVGYEYLGDSLGGFAEGGFEKRRRTEEYRRGLDSLETIASKNPAAILCAESDPTKCHRLGVAEDMEKRGWRVRHILSDGRACATADLPGAAAGK